MSSPAKLSLVMHMMPANLSLEDGELSYIDRWERMSIKDRLYRCCAYSFPFIFRYSMDDDWRGGMLCPLMNLVTSDMMKTKLEKLKYNYRRNYD